MPEESEQLPRPSGPQGRLSKLDVAKQSVGIGKDSDDIGPIYIIFAVMMGVGGLAILLIHAWHNVGATWIDVALFGIVAILVIAIIRPKYFKSTMETIADKLPVFKFTRGGNGASSRDKE